MAAHALQRGGLHHDAAILYLKKLNDPVAAAKAFEAAGAADRAIELLSPARPSRRPATCSAGSARRTPRSPSTCGPPDARGVGSPPDYHAAGRSSISRRGGPDLAIEQFRKGWDRRPAGNATLCAWSWPSSTAAAARSRSIRRLLDEADAFFRSVGSDRDAEPSITRRP